MPDMPMTPAQHYLEAERLLASAADALSQHFIDMRMFLVAQAQVHATLACTTGAYADAYHRANADAYHRAKGQPQ